MVIMQKKGNMPEYDIIQIILKCRVSKKYPIVLSPNLKRTYDQMDQTEK